MDASVILSSSAKKIISEEDMVLFYENEPLNSNRALRAATIEGKLNKLDTLTNQRGDLQVTVSKQREPSMCA